MVNWLGGNYNPSSGVISTAGKAFYRQSPGGCYTACAAMIMTNLNATWNGRTASYWNVYAANGNSVYLSGSTPGKFGCVRWDIARSKSSVTGAVKKYPQGVMVAFYQPNKGWNHCMVAVGLNANGGPLFFDPAIASGFNNGNGLTLAQTSAGGSYGGAGWENIVQVFVLSRERGAKKQSNSGLDCFFVSFCFLAVKLLFVPYFGSLAAGKNSRLQYGGISVRIDVKGEYKDE